MGGRRPNPTFFVSYEVAPVKQKNIIAIAVAVGFGLIAMFLAMRMTPSQTVVAAVDEVDVPVAMKDIPPNMKLTKDMLPPDNQEWVTTKKWPKQNLPPAYVGTVADLADKRVTRLMPAGSFFAPTDVTLRGSIEIPPGMNMYTIGIGGVAAVGGFAIPGQNVDILATFQLRKTKGPTVFPLLKNMKILAVDQMTGSANGQNAMAYGSVSFAVTKQQSMILKLATERGAALSFLLPSDQQTDKYPDNVPKGEEEVWKMLEAEFGTADKVEGEESKKPTKIAVAIFQADLPAGTQITEELLADNTKKIGMVEVSIPQPKGTIDNPKDKKYLGKFLKRDVSQGQLLLEDLLEETYKKPTEVTKNKPAPPDGSTEKPDPTIPDDVTPEPLPVFHDMTIQTATGARTFRYQVLKNGKYKFMGLAPVEAGPTTEMPEPKKKEPAPTPKGTDPKKPVL